MAANPRRVAEVHINFTMPEQTYSNQQKKIIELAATNCPVALSLHPDIKQQLVFVFNDERKAI